MCVCVCVSGNKASSSYLVIPKVSCLNQLCASQTKLVPLHVRVRGVRKLISAKTCNTTTDSSIKLEVKTGRDRTISTRQLLNASNPTWSTLKTTAWKQTTDVILSNRKSLNVRKSAQSFLQLLWQIMCFWKHYRPITWKFWLQQGSPISMEVNQGQNNNK